MDNLTARIEELNWVLRQIEQHNTYDKYSLTFDELENDIVGRLLALENEAIAKEALSRVR